MQLTQSFTELFGVVVIVLSLSADVLARPTLFNPASIGLYQSSQNGTELDVRNLKTRAPEPFKVLISAFQNAGGDVKQDIGYAMFLKVGTPSQNVILHVDTGSTTLWTVSKTCPQRGSRLVFDQTTSTTFQPPTPEQQWQIAYGDGSTARGPVGLDTVQVGNKLVPNFVIGLADTVTGNLVTDTRSGLIGFGNGQQGTTRTGGLTFLEALRAADLIPASMLGIQLGRSAGGKLGVGRLTLGGLDTTLFSTARGDIATVSNTGAGGLWQVALGPIKLDTVRMASRGSALLDTGASRILTSQEDAAAVHGLIPGAAQDENGIFALPCDTSKVLKFTVGNVEFPMDPSDLVGPPIAAGSKICLSNVQKSASKSTGQWSLGIVFLRNVYQGLDSDNNRIILAKLK